MAASHNRPDATLHIATHLTDATLHIAAHLTDATLHMPTCPHFTSTMVKFSFSRQSERKCYILVDQGKTMADMGTTGWQWFPIPYDGMSVV